MGHLYDATSLTPRGGNCCEYYSVQIGSVDRKTHSQSGPFLGGEVSEVFDQVDNYRVEIEAPKEVFEAFGIMESAEELGVDPDDEGLPPEAYERGRWN